jgi:hypothetical protein
MEKGLVEELDYGQIAAALHECVRILVGESFIEEIREPSKEILTELWEEATIKTVVAAAWRAKMLKENASRSYRSFQKVEIDLHVFVITDFYEFLSWCKVNKWKHNPTDDIVYKDYKGNIQEKFSVWRQSDKKPLIVYTNYDSEGGKKREAFFFEHEQDIFPKGATIKYSENEYNQMIKENQLKFETSLKERQ